jgi:transposase
VFLPKYSFDFNLIEQVFAKFKTLLQKAAAPTCDLVVNPSAAILAQYPPEE